MTTPRVLSASEIQKHNSFEDCWLVIDGNVWDLTEFAPQHPGGPGVIIKHAGHDATQAYSEVHPVSLLTRTLPASKLIGSLDLSTIDSSWSKPPPAESPQVQLSKSKPPLHTLLSSHDFESVAQKTLSPKTWAFYSSAATDLITAKANKSFYDRIWFRPRVLKDVAKVDTQCRIQGVKSRLPVIVAPAAMAGMVDKDGEKSIARGCEEKGIVQCVSNNASFPIEEIVGAVKPGYPFFFQLYVNRDRRKSELLLSQVWDLGIRTVFMTVDAPVSGKREADERVKSDENLSTPMSSMKAANDKKGGGLGRIMGSYIDSSLNWEDLKWLRKVWGGKIVIKGVQTAADAKRAVEERLDGIMISNHGGRNLDTSPPSVLVLLEFHKICPEIFDRLEVYIDGGIRRGTDILKAMCLGATAVSIGRTFLYALNYNSEGVKHFIEILRDELQIAMQMVGITTLEQAHPGLVNTADIDHLVPATDGHPYATKRATARSKL